jgi:hypothetical protein
MAFNHENLNVYQRMLSRWKALLQRVSVMTLSMIAEMQR